MSQMSTGDWVNCFYLMIFVFGAVAISLARAVDSRNAELKKWRSFAREFLGANPLTQQLVDTELTRFALLTRNSSGRLIELQRQDLAALGTEYAEDHEENLETTITTREHHFHTVQEKFYRLYDSAMALAPELHLGLGERSWKTYAKDKKRTA